MVCKYIPLRIIFYYLFNDFISKDNDTSFTQVWVQNVVTREANKILWVRKCKYCRIMANYYKKKLVLIKSRSSMDPKSVKTSWKIIVHYPYTLQILTCYDDFNCYDLFRIYKKYCEQYIIYATKSICDITFWVNSICFLFISIDCVHLHVLCAYICPCKGTKRRSWILLLMNGIHRKQFIL